MKFKILIRTEDGREWWEDYDKDIPDAQKWAEDTIGQFNKTLRPNEKSRTLLKVEVEDSSNDKHHRWRKYTGGMSSGKDGADIMYCERCGITGKRYGLSGLVTIDSKYRKKVFRQCDTARKETGKSWPQASLA